MLEPEETWPVSAQNKVRLRFVVAATLTDMRPIDLQPIGDELAIKWDDGSESFVKFETLRRACPCAGCMGETDVMGNLHIGPAKVLLPASFQLKRLAPVGGYALQIGRASCRERV